MDCLQRRGRLALGTRARSVNYKVLELSYKKSKLLVLGLIPVWSVIVQVTRSNWTPLSPITITNQGYR